jgi:hypothetical protein
MCCTYCVRHSEVISANRVSYCNHPPYNISLNMGCTYCVFDGEVTSVNKVLQKNRAGYYNHPTKCYNEK